MSELALRTALVTLIDGDAAIQTITGRSDRNLIAWGVELDPESTSYPVGTYRFVSGPRMGGTNGRRRIRCEIEWWSDLADAYAELEPLMDRTLALITGVNLDAQGVDAAVIPADDRRDGVVTNGLRSIQSDFLIELTI